MNTENAPKVTQIMENSVVILKPEFIPALEFPVLPCEVLVGFCDPLEVDLGVGTVPV